MSLSDPYLLADPYLLVERDEQLQTLCQSLAAADWLAIDTEFLREKTYYPQLCLIQVASAQQVACIDPLQVQSLAPFIALLSAPGITKVLHAARQDLELFWQKFQQLPAPIFDTQLAAPLLGYPEQMGYAALVKARLGVEIDKSETRTDWSQRPLSPAQLAYAAADVRYLAQLYPDLHAQLQARGRLQWLQDDFAGLLAPETYENPPEQAWRRLRGLHKLRGPALASAQALAAWRERRAQQEDRPRKWVLADDVLLTLARMKLGSVADLKRVRGVQAGFIERYGEELLALLATARTRAPEPLAEGERPSALTEDQEAAVDVLQGVLRQIAASAELNPSVIAGRKALQDLVRGERAASPLLQGWRRSLVGERLVAVLEGRLQLRLSAAGLLVEDPSQGDAISTKDLGRSSG